MTWREKLNRSWKDLSIKVFFLSKVTFYFWFEVYAIIKHILILLSDLRKTEYNLNWLNLTHREDRLLIFANPYHLCIAYFRSWSHVICAHHMDGSRCNFHSVESFVNIRSMIIWRNYIIWSAHITNLDTFLNVHWSLLTWEIDVSTIHKNVNVGHSCCPP